ncbi:MAG: TrbC/VirB2 family protein [Candidatus Magasanikbacteria bacterium]|nr:TrbC/VirB2 family protein [Candidatus Magasanikbacteria bacterium]
MYRNQPRNRHGNNGQTVKRVVIFGILAFIFLVNPTPALSQAIPCIQNEQCPAEHICNVDTVELADQPCERDDQCQDVFGEGGVNPDEVPDVLAGRPEDAREIICDQGMCKVRTGICQTLDAPPPKEDESKVLAGVSGIGDLDPINTEPEIALGRIIKSGLGIIGIVALLVILYAGTKWMLARGESKMVQEAQDTILWAVIGLAVIFGSYAITDFVIKNVQP